MPTAKENKITFWHSQVHSQRQWIEDHGGDLAGYIRNYGSKNDPQHGGDGGEAIYEADTAALKNYEARLSALRDPGRRVELSPGCDLWMRGARFGVVRSVEDDGTLKVKVDHPQVRKLVRLSPDRVTFLR